MVTRTITTPRRIFAGPALGLMFAAGIVVGAAGAQYAQASALHNTPAATLFGAPRHDINPQPLPPRFSR